MPFVDANALLRAMNAMEGDEGTVADTVPVSTGETVLNNENRTPILSPGDRSSVLMMMLRHHLGPGRFTKLVMDAATDMEVYGLVPDATVLKANLTGGHHGPMHGVHHAVACMMARNADTPAASALNAAEDAMHEAQHVIMETYAEPAKNIMIDILEEATTKIGAMQGDTGDLLKHEFADMITELNQTHNHH